MKPADDLAIAPEASTEDLIEMWAQRALRALRSHDRELAEELLVDILFLIGRGPRIPKGAP